jgi:hypothetical protein
VQTVTSVFEKPSELKSGIGVAFLAISFLPSTFRIANEHQQWQFAELLA